MRRSCCIRAIGSSVPSRESSTRKRCCRSPKIICEVRVLAPFSLSLCCTRSERRIVWLLQPNPFLRKGLGWSSQTMRRSDLVQHKEREKGASTRTSQIIFGERQHLLRVLDSLEGTELPIARMQQERRILEELIHARTRDLNQINTAWDEKIGLVLSADAKPEMLEKLVKQAPE